MKALTLIQTVKGIEYCGVPEFKPAEYKGLRSGIGKQRRSSKHFGCNMLCCTFGRPSPKVFDPKS